MADNSTQIDELRLDITVEDKTSGESSSKKVRALSTAISRLDKVISNFNATKMKNVFDKMTASLKPFTSELKKASKEIISLGIISKQMGIEKISKDMPEIKLETEMTEVPDISKDKLPTVATTNIKELNAELKNVAKNSKSTISPLKNMFGTISKTSGGILKSILRIGFYRLVRTALKFIVNAIKESASEISNISPEYNKTISSVTSSIDKIKASIAVIGANLLPIIEPIIRNFANIITTISNGIGKILSAFYGQGKAIQANTEYMKDYNKEQEKGSLLSFDTFNTLKTQNDSDLYKTEEVDTLGNGVTGILDAITPIIDFVNELITIIVDSLMPVLTKLGDYISGFGESLKGGFKIISGLLKILTGDFSGAWKSIANGFAGIINGISNIFIAFVNLLISGLNIILKPIDAIAGIFGGKVEIPYWNAKANWQPYAYANGGDFKTSDLFYANEDGKTELIASTNNGGAVMNMEQLKSAIFEGMIMAMAQNGNAKQEIYLDGNKIGTFIAGNSGFRAEANRRNSGLNWK